MRSSGLRWGLGAYGRAIGTGAAGCTHGSRQALQLSRWAYRGKSRRGSGRQMKATSLPRQAEPGGTLQPALQGDGHERDNGLFRVNRS